MQGAPVALAGAQCQSVWQDAEEWTEKGGKTSAALKLSGLERRPSLGDDRQRWLEGLVETAKGLVRKRVVLRTPRAGGADGSFSTHPQLPASICPSAESWPGRVLCCHLGWNPSAPIRTPHAFPPL